MKKIISMLLIVSMLFMCSCSLSKNQETTETEPESLSEIETKSETESQTETTSETETEVSSEEKLKEENNTYIELAKHFFEGKENAYVQINSTTKYKSGAEMIAVYATAKNGNMFSISAPVKGTNNDGSTYEGRYCLETYDVGETSYAHIGLNHGDEIKENTWCKTTSSDKTENESTKFNPDEMTEYFDAEDVSIKKEGDTYIVTFTSYDVVTNILNEAEEILEATDWYDEEDVDMDISAVFDAEEGENKIETTESLKRTICTCYINSETRLIEKITVSDNESETTMEFNWDYETMDVPEEASFAYEVTGEEFVNTVIETMFAMAVSVAVQ